eukprot:6482244-Amphidinium_carterae.3
MMTGSRKHMLAANSCIFFCFFRGALNEHHFVATSQRKPTGAKSGESTESPLKVLIKVDLPGADVYTSIAEDAIAEHPVTSFCFSNN